MRHSKKFIDKCRMMGRRSQEVQGNKWLQSAVDLRPTESYLVFELGTHNPRTGVYHFMEIRHDILNGNDRYNVYLDGKMWHKPWSRTGFCRWMFDKIESVRCA